MDNSSLLNYALKRRNFLVAMWLMLQQRWFVRSFNASARVVSWMVIALGMSLVTLTVVTLARNVVPVLTTPYTLPYALLQLLVMIVAFNIYVNYLCATAFSRRLGVAPADYVYTDPYGRSAGSLPTDDSASATSTDEEGENDERNSAAAVRVVVNSGDAHSLSHTQPLQYAEELKRPDGEEATQEAAAVAVQALDATTTAAPAAVCPTSPPPPPPRRYAGIQVVRVFGSDPPAVPSTSSLSFPPHSGLSRQQQHQQQQQPDGVQQRRTPLSATLADDTAAALMEEDASAYNAIGRQGRGGVLQRVLRGRGGGSWTRRLCICLQPMWRRFVPHAAKASHACTCGHTPTVASVSVVRELEHIAATAERYGPRQRGFRVLDAPRRYCSHCRRLKAPREHHCAICNECVAKMDHHCPWINNCVGIENQRYFILFIAWLWLGTLLASAFVGYGVARQQRYTTQYAKLYALWLRSPAKGDLYQQMQALRMPYGPAGVLLTSYPTIMVLAISITMCLCMTFFIYFNRRLVFENTTVIESIFVDERRLQANRGAGMRYRNPYDLGGWFNFLDMFATAGDPVVRRATEKLERTSQTVGASLQPEDNAPAGAAAAEEQQLRQRGGGSCWWATARNVLSRVGVVVWLVGFPTLRPTHGDGVHYATFDALASGEQRSFLRS